MIRIFIFLCAFLFTLPAIAQEKTFNAQETKLENGMRVVVIPNHRAPVVTHMVWYRVGAADEAPGKSGIAHFLEHLMFKGSLGFAPGEFSETVKALGGNDNAFTAQDYTAYFQSVASKHLPLVMRMEAGRMRGMNPPLKEVESERDVILEERRQRTDNDPEARFAEPLDAALFVNHPYGKPVIGWFHEMEKLSWEDAKSFYDRYYGPNNAILVVAGDVQAQDVFKLAQEIYGVLPKIDVPKRNWTSSPPLPANTLLTMEDASVRETSVQISLRAPSARQDKNASLALEVIADILGNGPTSRLYKAVVIDKKIASQAGAYYDGGAWSDGQFHLYASPLPGVSPEEIEKALRAELDLMAVSGVSEEELREAKARMQNEAIYARDSLTGPAMIIGRALIAGATLEDVEFWPRDIANVNPAQVSDAAKAWLDLDKNRAVTGYLLPEQKPAPAAPETPEEAPQE